MSAPATTTAAKTDDKTDDKSNNVADDDNDGQQPQEQQKRPSSSYRPASSNKRPRNERTRNKSQNNNNNILLGITGSVAAIKGPEIAIRLKLELGLNVRILLTKGGEYFWNKSKDYNSYYWNLLHTKHLARHPSLLSTFLLGNGFWWTV